MKTALQIIISIGVKLITQAGLWITISDGMHDTRNLVKFGKQRFHFLIDSDIAETDVERITLRRTPEGPQFDRNTPRPDQRAIEPSFRMRSPVDQTRPSQKGSRSIGGGGI